MFKKYYLLKQLYENGAVSDDSSCKEPDSGESEYAYTASEASQTQISNKHSLNTSIFWSTHLQGHCFSPEGKAFLSVKQYAIVLENKGVLSLTRGLVIEFLVAIVLNLALSSRPLGSRRATGRPAYTADLTPQNPNHKSNLSIMLKNTKSTSKMMQGQ